MAKRLTSAISGGDQAYHDNHLAGVAYIQILTWAGLQTPAAVFPGPDAEVHLLVLQVVPLSCGIASGGHITQPG